MERQLMEYFIEESNKKFDLIHDDLAEIKKDMQRLISFRIMLLGLASFVSALVALFIEYIR